MKINTTRTKRTNKFIHSNLRIYNEITMEQNLEA